MYGYIGVCIYKTGKTGIVSEICQIPEVIVYACVYIYGELMFANKHL